MTSKTIGQQLRQAREAKGLSVHQVSHEIDMTANSIYRHERGEVVPSDDVCERYARLYGLTYRAGGFVG